MTIYSTESVFGRTFHEQGKKMAAMIANSQQLRHARERLAVTVDLPGARPLFAVLAHAQHVATHRTVTVRHARRLPCQLDGLRN